jgi:hypothetical protein
MKIDEPKLEVPSKKEELLKMKEVIAKFKETKIPTKTFKTKDSEGKVKHNVGRVNVFGGKDKTEEVKMTAMVLGKVRHYFKSDLVNSTATREHKELHKLLNELMKLHNPKFKYTSIQINKNVNCKWHFDKNNKGNSYCISFGDFDGGGIDMKLNGKIVNFNNKNKWVYYDGGNIEHRTAKLKGDRIAVIYYTRRPIGEKKIEKK